MTVGDREKPMNRFDKGRLISINPATGKILGEVEVTPPGRVHDAGKKAREAFSGWKATSLSERIRILAHVRRLLLERRESIARLITDEMGRPLSESLGLEVHSAIDLTGYYTARAHRFLDDRRVLLHHLLFKRRRSWVHFEPLGVLGIIAPWNWPLLIPMGGIVPALLAGNAVIFKHSEHTPLMAETLRRLFMDAGVPEPVFQIVQGGAETGQALIDSPVQKIFFTGSTDVGRRVLAQASAGLKKCVLEMGGSDPAVVCADADPDYTASGLAWGAYSNCGQNCNGVERIIVHRSAADGLVERLLDRIRKLRMGNGWEDGTDIGPLASREQLEKMNRLMRLYRKQGGDVLIGGRPVEGPGYFFEPTLIRWKSHDMIPKEEVFGPVAHIAAAEDDRQAVEWANDSGFGLAASVWSGNPARARRLAEELEAGTVMINDVIVSFGMPEAGWTGIKQSGIGWVHGEKGLDEMVNIKFISREVQDRIQKYWWFPYSFRQVKTLSKALEFLFGERLKTRLSAMIPTALNFGPFMLRNRRRNDKL